MRFGEVVQVEYVDMADPQAQVDFPELVAVVEEQDLPYPLVAVNNRLRLAGSAQYPQVFPLVDQALQEENALPEA